MARAQHPPAWTGSLDACVTPWGPAGHREWGWRVADTCLLSQHSLPGSEGHGPSRPWTAFQPPAWGGRDAGGPRWCWWAGGCPAPAAARHLQGEGSFRARLIPAPANGCQAEHPPEHPAEARAWLYFCLAPLGPPSTQGCTAGGLPGALPGTQSCRATSGGDAAMSRIQTTVPRPVSAAGTGAVRGLPWPERSLLILQCAWADPLPPHGGIH